MARWAWPTLVFPLLFASYSNHFQFDDFHTIQNNLYVRLLANIPFFFRDASTFSNLPTHQVLPGRGLMNKGLALMGRGATAKALNYFEIHLEG